MSVSLARYRCGAPRREGTARPRLLDHRAGNPGEAGSWICLAPAPARRSALEADLLRGGFRIPQASRSRPPSPASPPTTARGQQGPWRLRRPVPTPSSLAHLMPQGRRGPAGTGIPAGVMPQCAAEAPQHDSERNLHIYYGPSCPENARTCRGQGRAPPHDRAFTVPRLLSRQSGTLPGEDAG